MVDRLNTLNKLSSLIASNNSKFKEVEETVKHSSAVILQLEQLLSIAEALSKEIQNGEKQWQDWAIKDLETTINKCLSIVFPTDGYCIHLNVVTRYNKIRLTTTVSSPFISNCLTIKESQGRLFQQTVSFGAILAFMKFIGTNTIYIDEAFSGTAISNWDKVNALLEYALSRGANIIMITQNSDINLPANIYNFQRDSLNLSHITYERRS